MSMNMLRKQKSEKIQYSKRLHYRERVLVRKKKQDRQLTKIKKFKFSFFYIICIFFCLTLTSCSKDKSKIDNIELNKNEQDVSQQGSLKEDTDSQEQGEFVQGTIGDETFNEQISRDSILTVHFLSIGKADCILIKIDDHAVLIDSGTSDKADFIIKYLKSQNVTTLDYAIATHCDKDHVGGMGAILEEFKTNTLLMSERGKKTTVYKSMIATAIDKQVTRIIPKVKTTFYVGNAKFTVLGPGEAAIAQNSDNESSIVLMMQYGDNRFLFMGDAMKYSEKELLESGFDLHADVIKIGHHGSKQCSGKKFLETVKPAVAVITCDENDDSGLPAKKILNRLKELGMIIYRTDKDGTIVMQSDGTDIKITNYK